MVTQTTLDGEFHGTRKTSKKHDVVVVVNMIIVAVGSKKLNGIIGEA